MKIHKQSWSISHIVCKVIVVMIVLEGLGGPGTLLMTRVEGASRKNQATISGGGGGGENTGNINRFDTFGGGGSGGGGGEMKRMRDRCGRYSLLRVLQQWENLQKRCRLSVRNNLNKERGRYEYVRGNGPPSPTEIDDIAIEKRTDFYEGSAVAASDSRHRNHYYEINRDALASCCPVVFEVIAPIYGRNRSGHMVELYKDEHVQQKFYEYRCHKDYLDQPCRFIDGQHRKISKCVQQHLDTYALVRSDTSVTGWSMEHIRVASGCACKVDHVKASRRRKKVPASTSQRNNNNFFLGEGAAAGGNGNKRGVTFQQQRFRSNVFDY